MVSLRVSLQGIVVATTLIDRARGMFLRAEPVTAAKTGQPDKPARKPSTTPYHAVSIQPGRQCCHESRALEGQRFLSREAPSLPLKHCTAATCTCHYLHHDDRRTGPRRARDMGVALDSWMEVDHRAEKGRGRRKTDRS